MKKLIIWLTLTLYLSASVIDFETLKVNFTQSVQTEEEQSIHYHGTLWLKQPDQALWYYESPIEKSIFVRSQRVTILEPELFQATHLTQHAVQNILEIYQGSQRVDATTRLAELNGLAVTLKHNDEFLTQISYQDEFGHRVTIGFEKPEKNLWLEADFFYPRIPAGFDEIRAQ